MLIYILKSTTCLAILLLFYKLFLEKENMHVFKRFYLLGALVFSLTIPLLVFTEYVVVEPTPEVLAQPITRSADVIEVPPALEADVLDVAPLLWGVYFLGLIFFGLNFVKNLVQVYRRIKNNPKEKDASFIRVLLRENFPPHTFFNYIFLNKAKLESKEIPEEVILHEETHAKQKHSLDVLFVELLQVAIWFNPLIYFTRKSIKLNHEFLADSAVLQKGTDSSTYQNTLLSFMTPDYKDSLANAINYSSIKKRFTVMKSKTSKKAVLLRSLLLLPLLALLLFSFTQTKLVERYSERPTEIQGNWIEEENELYELSISKTGSDVLLKWNNGTSWPIQELSGKYFHVDSNNTKKRKPPIHFDSEKATLVFYGNVKYIPLEKSFKGKLYGNWENKEKDIKFHVLHSGNEIVWDVIKANGKPVRYYPKKQGDRYAFTYGKELELWSFKVENGVLYDSDGVAYQRIIAAAEQEGATKEQVSEYNALINKYEDLNGAPRMEKSDLERLKYLHKLMTLEHLENIDFIHDYSGPDQEGATKEQLAEYNSLAKKYNLMINAEENIWIKKGDVDRLEYLHSIMSEEQRANAEPFPDFPEPPEPPEAPEELEKEMIEMEREMERQAQVMEERQVKMKKQVKTTEEEQVKLERQVKVTEEQKIKIKEHRKLQPTSPEAPGVSKSEQTDFPAPPNLAYRIDQKPLTKELKKLVDNYAKKRKSYQNAVNDYLNRGKGNEDKIHGLYENLLGAYGEYKVRATDEGVFALPSPAFSPIVPEAEKSNIPPPPPPTYVDVPVTPESTSNRLREELKSKNSSKEIIVVPDGPKRLTGSPPPPPPPKSPLEHIEEMAKKNAIFYHEGKKISADKAIDILKKFDKTSIRTRHEGLKRPIVELSAKPIVIEN